MGVIRNVINKITGKNKNTNSIGNILVKPSEVSQFTNYKPGKSPTIQVVGGTTQQTTSGTTAVTSTNNNALNQIPSGDIQKIKTSSSGGSNKTIQTDIKQLNTVQPTQQNASIFNKIINAPLRFLSGNYTWQQNFENTMRQNNTSMDRWLERQRKASLPYGLQTGVNIGSGNIGYKEQQVISGKTFNPFLPTFYLAKPIAESKPISNIVYNLNQSNPESYQSIANSLAPLLSSLTAGISIGTFFTPAMSSATYSQQTKKQTTSPLSKNRFDELKSKLDGVTEIVSSKKTTKEQLEVLKNIRNNLKDPDAIKNFQSYARELVNQGIIKLPNPKAPPTPQTETIRQLTIDLQIDIPTNLKAVGEITGSGSISQNQQAVYSSNVFDSTSQTAQQGKIDTDLTQESRLNDLDVTRLDTNQITLVSGKLSVRQKNKQASDNMELLGQPVSQKFSQPQPQKESTLLRTPQRSFQPIKEIPKIPSRFIPKVPLSPKRFKDPFKFKILKPKQQQRKIYPSKKRKIEEEMFFGITKRYGKEFVVSRGKNPLIVGREGKKYVLGNLSASLKVVSSKGRQIKLNEDPFFKASKTDPLKLVQRKTASGFYRGRLSSLGERQEIKLLKKSKKGKLF